MSKVAQLSLAIVTHPLTSVTYITDYCYTERCAYNEPSDSSALRFGAAEANPWKNIAWMMLTKSKAWNFISIFLFR